MSVPLFQNLGYLEKILKSANKSVRAFIYLLLVGCSIFFVLTSTVEAGTAPEISNISAQ